MAIRKPRLYGLYRVISGPTGRSYLREFPALAYPKEQAIRVFQNALLGGMMAGIIRELRPLNRGMFGQ